jgi:hypothetical protein
MDYLFVADLRVAHCLFLKSIPAKFWHVIAIDAPLRAAVGSRFSI